MNHPAELDRRKFVQAAAVGTAGLLTGNFVSPTLAAEPKTPESLVKVLFDGLSALQRDLLCFEWDHVDDNRGLLRTRVSNNWHVTRPTINSDFFSVEQRKLIRDIWEGIIRPEWHEKIDRQLKDDAGGFGNSQNIAIFGTPGSGKFEMVMTGRHMTLRCDGNSAEHVAFGGPIFYGHAPRFYEKENHPGNVYWEQALVANKVHQMLDGKQREQAEVKRTPREQLVQFKGDKGPFSGIAVSDLSGDQKAHVQKVLQKLIEPYRQSDQDEVVAALKAQGGLDACHLAFFTDKDLGNDGIWDNWRLEGPAFVWHFRGAPHVHVWANIASSPDVKLNA